MVWTIEEAVDIRDAVLSGQSRFSRLAEERSLDPATAPAGGYLGRVRVSDLQAGIRQALSGLGPGDISAPVPIADAYFLFELVPSVELDWLDSEQAGIQSLERGAVAEAVSHLERAVDLAEESFPTDDPRRIRSLGTLAEAYRLGQRPEEAESAYRQTLEAVGSASDGEASSDVDRAQLHNGLGQTLSSQGRLGEAEDAFREAEQIRIRVYGPDHPEVAVVRYNLADVIALGGDPLSAHRLYEDAIGRIESALGPDDPTTSASRERFAAFRRSLVAVVLDRVARLIGLADFQDAAFEERVDEMVEIVRLAPLTERGFTQVRAALLQAALSEPTERVLQVGLERFPDTRVLRLHLADIYAGTGRTQDALRMLEEAGALPRPDGTDDAADIRQQAVILQRIGDMHLALFHYDEAIASYQRMIAVDPTASEGRRKLGVAYAASSRLEDALVELRNAAADLPDDASLELELAETLLSMGRPAEAIAAADRAIALGTVDPSVLYIRGRALLMDGRVEEGQSQVREYQQIDAELRGEETRERNIDATTNRALQAFRDGDPEAALRVLEEGTETYPDSERLLWAGGIILGRSGRYAEAVERFGAMLERGLGRPFLIHLQLAEWYGALGNADAGRYHQDIYEQTRESELVVFAPE